MSLQPCWRDKTHTYSEETLRCEWNELQRRRKEACSLQWGGGRGLIHVLPSLFVCLQFHSQPQSHSSQSRWTNSKQTNKTEIEVYQHCVRCSRTMSTTMGNLRFYLICKHVGGSCPTSPSADMEWPRWMGIHSGFAT